MSKKIPFYLLFYVLIFSLFLYQCINFPDLIDFGTTGEETFTSRQSPENETNESLIEKLSQEETAIETICRSSQIETLLETLGESFQVETGWMSSIDSLSQEETTIETIEITGGSSQMETVFKTIEGSSQIETGWMSSISELSQEETDKNPTEGMVYVPGGNFWRGSCNESTSPSCKLGEPGYALSDPPDSMDTSEVPLMEIYLYGYYIDIYEVTVEKYIECVSARKCNGSNFRNYSTDSYCNYGNPVRTNYPMNCVSWYGAKEYCEYLGKRLPTEAEWEKASRGTDGRKYPWGNDEPTCDYANFFDAYGTGTFCVSNTTPVGAYPKNISPYGAYDMAGNVMEWVNDWYDNKYYSTSPDTNPPGSESGVGRVLRGGCFVSPSPRTALRGGVSPEHSASYVGFRCLIEEKVELHDRDGDKVGDDSDNCPTLSNGDQIDSDGDGLGNVCDNCPTTNNLDQKDSDSDNIGDVCDNCPSIANNDQKDSDSDLFGDSCDNCSSIANNDQKDTDSDLFGDSCDNCPSIANNDQKDSDNDLFGNACDNCPYTINSEQLDSDNDRVGDSCDKCSEGNDLLDSDKDSIPDACDNCPEDTNKDQVDCDGDSLGDVCDEDNTSCIPEDIMVHVPAGKFWRGSCNESTSPSCDPGEPGYALSDQPDWMRSSEVPLKEIYLDGYYIDTYEVTASDFETCVTAGKCTSSNYLTYSFSTYPYCNHGNPEKKNHPMNCVNWYGAKEYCEYAWKRLPTEAEWEKAARGIDGRKYPWGNTGLTCEYANFYELYGKVSYCVMDTTPVGSYPLNVSPYGAYDMAGNVWEWVEDWYDGSYYNTSPDTNPQGPSTGSDRIHRGGGWYDYEYDLRSAYRNTHIPSYHTYGSGFRCARGQ